MQFIGLKLLQFSFTRFKTECNHPKVTAQLLSRKWQQVIAMEHLLKHLSHFVPRSSTKYMPSAQYPQCAEHRCKQHIKLISKSLTFNSAGAIVAGANNTIPVEDGMIVELDFIPYGASSTTTAPCICSRNAWAQVSRFPIRHCSSKTRLFSRVVEMAEFDPALTLDLMKSRLGIKVDTLDEYLTQVVRAARAKGAVTQLHPWLESKV